MLPSAGIQVSTPNLEERGEQGQVRPSLPTPRARFDPAEPHRRFLDRETPLSGLRSRQKAEAEGRPTRHQGALYPLFAHVLTAFPPFIGAKCGQGKRKAISAFRLASARSYPEGRSPDLRYLGCKTPRCSGPR